MVMESASGCDLSAPACKYRPSQHDWLKAIAGWQITPQCRCSCKRTMKAHRPCTTTRRICSHVTDNNDPTPHAPGRDVGKVKPRFAGAFYWAIGGERDEHEKRWRASIPLSCAAWKGGANRDDLARLLRGKRYPRSGSASCRRRKENWGDRGSSKCPRRLFIC